MAETKPIHTDVNFSGLTTATNTGSGGGTYQYINLGGLKFLMGRTAQYTGLGAGAILTRQVNFPVGFFNSIITGVASVDELGTTASQTFYGNTRPSTTSWVLTAFNFGGTAGGSGYIDYVVIGT